MSTTSISRQALEKACRILRQPRKTASLRTLAAACDLPQDAIKRLIQTLRSQPYVVSICNDKGTFLSYSFTNYAPKLVHMSFCAVVCEGIVVHGSQSPAAPMFDAQTQADLRDRYQALAKKNDWVYLDVTHDHMVHLLEVLQCQPDLVSATT